MTRSITMLLALAALLALPACTLLQAHYVPLCEGNPIATPCIGFCDVPKQTLNGPTVKRLPLALLITDQEGRMACQEVDAQRAWF